ncbi:MAG: hypothetical protein Q8N87_00320 [bacterium]|nr:hypothetical protein [bacterium]
MAWAQEMKNLAVEIKTGHQSRTARISEVKKETRDILGEADDYMKGVATELKEMARDLKNFLAKSEEARKKDFRVMMGGIQAKIKDIKGEVKDFLAKNEEKRMADFKALMKDVTGAVDTIEKSTKDLLGSYRGERKEAARYWAGIKGKKGVEEISAAPKKRGRKKK